MKIVTRLQAAGLWTAVDDSAYEPGCPIGVGRSEAAAVADLKSQLEEKAREYTGAFYQDACDRRCGRDQ